MTINPALKAGPREWVGLAVLALPTMLLSLDLSVLFLALPHLSADLAASSTHQLWIIDIYGFMTAGFLITMGTLGDRIGRRKLLSIGAAAFGAISILAAYSANAEMLIVARGLLGVAGATLLPSTLALIRSMFRDPGQLGIAIAAWTTSYMAGIALGPLVGGVLLEYFWWGSVFLVGVPVMALLLATGPFLLPEHRDPDPGRLDFSSVLLSLAAILLVIYGLKELARYGFNLLPVAATVAGVILGAIFVLRQSRLINPLLDLRLFRIPTVRGTLILAMLVAVVQNGNMFVIALYLQTVQELSPLRAGLWLVVPSVALILTINAAPHLSRRFRPGNVFAAGLIVSALGYLLLTQVERTSGLPVVVIGAIIVFAGVGPPGALINHLVLGATPSEKAGTAASMASTSGELGIALGVATLGSLASVVYRGQVTVPVGLSEESAAAIREGILGAVAAKAALPAELAVGLLDSAREAFTNALNTVAALSVILFVFGALAATFVLRHVPRTGDPAESGKHPASR